MFEDDRPKPKPAYVLGQDISTFSVEELDETVGLLREEITRLEAERKRKSAGLDAAAALFRK